MVDVTNIFIRTERLA